MSWAETGKRRGTRKGLYSIQRSAVLKDGRGMESIPRGDGIKDSYLSKEVT